MPTTDTAESLALVRWSDGQVRRKEVVGGIKKKWKCMKSRLAAGSREEEGGEKERSGVAVEEPLVNEQERTW
jgi:hypothetical protein